MTTVEERIHHLKQGAVVEAAPAMRGLSAEPVCLRVLKRTRYEGGKGGSRVMLEFEACYFSVPIAEYTCKIPLGPDGLPSGPAVWRMKETA